MKTILLALISGALWQTPPGMLCAGRTTTATAEANLYHTRRCRLRRLRPCPLRTWQQRVRTCTSGLSTSTSSKPTKLRGRGGFKPSCLLTWAKKPHGIGIGGTYAQTTEHVLFARRGTCKALRRVDSTWWTWPRGRHSAKPEAFQDMVEAVSPGPRLELFARRARPGWTVWGNEVEANAKCAGADASEKTL